MAKRDNPRIAVVADTQYQRHALSNVIRSQGYDVVMTIDPLQVSEDVLLTPGVDVWLVELEQQDSLDQCVDTFLGVATAPVLFGDGHAPPQSGHQYRRWRRRVLAKIMAVVGEAIPRLVAEAPTQALLQDPVDAVVLLDDESMHERAQRVWLLGASLGGPEAVKAFLDALPESLPVAFILVQHIDKSFQETLAQVLRRNNHYDVHMARAGETVCNGQVLVAPADEEMGIDERGRVRFLGHAWPGPYAPSIDAMMKHVVNAYGRRSGAIVFSGMGDDGAVAGPYMTERGARVWAQSHDSCANSSQPDAVRATGCVSFEGVPARLAEQLAVRIQAESGLAVS